jgi:SAM-dependent methyltransferase
MTWTQVDEGWGRKAVEYAYLFEAQMWREYLQVLDACEVDAHTNLLDVACGPGLAVRMARDRGATVAAIDASPRLIELAKVRTPDGDLRVGDMFDLPWPDGTFDVVTSFRGIWGGCEGALSEAARVCRADGRVGISFWGNAKRMPAYPLLRLLGEVEQHERDHAKEMANIAWEGVAEQMMTDAGLRPGRRWSTTITLEFPDAELTARAFASGGPSYLAIKSIGEDAFLARARLAAEQLAVRDAGVRVGFTVQFLVGIKPA